MELFTDASSQSVAFPLYDGHGNMIATLARDSRSPHYMVANVRTYDAWGGIRSGSATGNPAQRYCASLGHRADDETAGLIYMRARYYEPWTGRFVSEDYGHDGWNWYAYCKCNPVNQLDQSGDFTISEVLLSGAIRAGLVNASISGFLSLIQGQGLAGFLSDVSKGFACGYASYGGSVWKILTTTGLANFLAEMMKGKTPGASFRKALTATTFAGLGLWYAGEDGDRLTTWFIVLDANQGTDDFINYMELEHE